MKGNLGALYVSSLLSNGSYRWIKYPPSKKVDTPSDKSDTRMMVKNSVLSPRESKWCRCVLHVAAKQTSECLRTKKWRQVVDGQKCVNPYAVCSDKVGTSSKEKGCVMWYNFDELTKDELWGYVNLKNLRIRKQASEAELLKAIEKYKRKISQ